MNRLVSCGVALVALTASGWSNASPLDISQLCGGFEILNDPENRVYRGEFKSKGVTLETALVITPVTSSNVTVVFYVWGEQPKWKIAQAGCVPGLGGWKKDTLLVTTRRGKNNVKYKFSGDEAAVTFKGRGGSTTKGKVTLSEMTVSDSPATTAQQAEEASTAAVPGKRRITTEQEYRDAVVGKKFGNKHGYFVVHDDGTYTGESAARN